MQLIQSFTKFKEKTKYVTSHAGDYNIDLLKSESCDFSNRFIEQLFTSSFFPLINKPTRITAHSATLIDNIYTNDFEKINYSTSGIIISDIFQTIYLYCYSSFVQYGQ